METTIIPIIFLISTGFMILPDSPLYGFKLFGENISENFTFDDLKRAELKLKHAEERTKEIETMMIENKEVPESVVDDKEQKTRDADAIIARIEASEGKHDGEFLDSLRQKLMIAFKQVEIDQVRADYTRLINEDDVEERKRLAKELDEKVNKASINILCLGVLSSEKIAESSSPINELKKQCPILTPFDLKEEITDIDRGY